MFWGLIMEPGKKYSQTVQKSFHISHAALDLDTASMDPVQVLLGFDSRNYLVCTLQKGKWIQAPLDLNFQVGDSVSFATNGPGHVHLTGYLVPEDDFDMQEEEEESDEEVPELVPAKKRKALGNKTDSVAKKSKTALLLDEINTEDSDDSDDSDVNLTDMLEEAEEEAEDEESGEEVEDGDDDDDDDEDDDDDDDDEEMEEDESDDEEQKVQAKAKKDSSSPVKQNGVAKKEKTPKANQSPNKQEKQGKVQQNEKPQKAEKSKAQKAQGAANKKTIEGGVVVEDMKVGDGPLAKPGKLVQVYYEGRLKTNNKMFDSSTKGPGFKFRLGRQEVIKGWDVGVAGMKVGGKRRITCPPNMAYGAQGSPPVIPPGSTLIFEVELKNVKN